MLQDFHLIFELFVLPFVLLDLGVIWLRHESGDVTHFRELLLIIHNSCFLLLEPESELGVLRLQGQQLVLQLGNFISLQDEPILELTQHRLVFLLNILDLMGVLGLSGYKGRVHHVLLALVLFDQLV